MRASFINVSTNTDNHNKFNKYVTEVMQVDHVQRVETGKLLHLWSVKSKFRLRSYMTYEDLLKFSQLGYMFKISVVNALILYVSCRDLHVCIRSHTRQLSALSSLVSELSPCEHTRGCSDGAGHRLHSVFGQGHVP